MAQRWDGGKVRREESLREVERMAARLGFPWEEDGVKRVVTLPSGRRLRLSGGAGLGTLTAEGLDENGEPDSVVVLTPGKVINTLVRAAADGGQDGGV